MNKSIFTLQILLILILSITNFAQIIDKPNETLPVELTYFVGDVEDSVVVLRWETATEVNNYGYNLLRSDTSFTWGKIGFINGHGNSYSPKEYSYNDTTITENGEYFYLLEQIDTDGITELQHDTVKVIVDFATSIAENIFDKNMKPEKFKLFQNYPNPFNPETNITFEIMQKGNVALELYSVTGEKFKDIYSGSVIPGTYNIKFNANNLSTGTYIYKLVFGNNFISKKMIFIK